MKRDRQARWDAGHMHSVTTRLTTREFVEFRARCLASGTTPYALVKRLVRAWVAE